MCFTVKYITQKKLKYAKRRGDRPDDISRIEKDLESFNLQAQYAASGFSHPKLLVFRDCTPLIPEFIPWGLIPHWVRSDEQAAQIQNKTLNARGETIFDKPSFKKAAIDQRCLIMVDGFYDYHYKNGKAYPFYIQYKDKEPMVFAGLWDMYQGQPTVTIVTNKAEGVVKKIHNNPKNKEARTPLILNTETEISWLNSGFNTTKLASILHHSIDQKLEAYSVLPLKGKLSPGNSSQASEPYCYPELQENTLF